MGGGVSAYSEALVVLRNTVCPFKKYHGEVWEWVVDNDPSYVKWVLSNVDDLDEDLRRALEAVI
jgi:uncharacterized protein (DUF3820 family)